VLIETLIEPFQHTFVLRGMLAALMVGALGGVIGSYIVVRGMAFFGDALAHSILPGVAIAYLLGGELFWGGLAAAILSALAIGLLTRGGQVKEDTAIGVVFSGAFAAGIAIISSIQQYTDLGHILFGYILAVDGHDLALILVSGGLVLLAVFFFYRQFLVISFDPGLAATLGLRADFYRYLLLVMTAVTVVVGLQAVGVVLMVAMLVTPAAAAYLLTRRLSVMMPLAAAIGGGSGVFGFYIAWFTNTATGATIVLTCTLIFLLALLFAPGRGLLLRGGAG
jgi:manganese/iron transport system permease protein